MKLIGERVLVELAPKTEKTGSGVILPESKKTQNEGTVVLVSDKVDCLKVGDKVRFYPSCGVPVDYLKKKCLILRQGEIEVIL